MGCVVGTEQGPSPDPSKQPDDVAVLAPPVKDKASKKSNEDEEGDMSTLFWSDFQVDTREEAFKPLKSSRKKDAVVSDDTGKATDTKTFVFADFKVVRTEDELEEKIVAKYLQKKTFKWGDFSPEDEGNPYLFMLRSHDEKRDEERVDQVTFGDFNVDVYQEDVEAADKRDIAFRARKTFGIRHFSIRTLLGHSARVKCIAIAPAETHFVSSSSKDDRITMWDINTGEQRLVFQGHEDTIISAKFSADGRYLATTSRDRTLMIWDTVIGKQMFILEHAKIVICCAFSPDGKLIVSGCQDRACRVWNTKRGKELASFAEHDGIITSVAFSPNSQYVASASSDWSLMLWRASNAQRVATLSAHSGIVLSCSFSPDGNSIISSDERLLHVWDISNPDDPQTKLSLPVDDVAKSSGGKDAVVKRKTWTVASYAPAAFPDFILAACSDRHVYVIDPKDGSEVLSFFTKAAVYCLSTSRSNVMFGDAFGNVYVAEMS